MSHSGPLDYPITLKMVQDYLSTLEPDDEAGIAFNAFRCPVANAAKYHYGIPFVVTAEHYYPNVEPWTTETTPSEIAEVIRAVDGVDQMREHSITREEVESAAPVLLREDL